MAEKLYFNPKRASGFSSLKQLHAAARDSRIGKTAGELIAWLEPQDAYTLHRPVRKSFPRNPYTVNNIMDIWDCDLVDVQGLNKYKNGIKYLLSVIDVFSKYLHVVTLKSTTVPSVTSAVQPFLNDPKYSNPIRSRPICVQTDRGKEFLNRPF